jgi:hypothetical protein
MNKKKTVFAEVDLEAARRQYVEESRRLIHNDEAVDRLTELAKAVQAEKRKRRKKKK